MIFQLFINAGYTLLSGIIGLLPASQGFPASVLSGAQLIGGYVGIFSPIIDAGQLTLALLFVFGVEIAIFGFKTVMRLISHIPFIGGKG